MKNLLFLFVTCIAVWACSKEEQLVKATTTNSSRTTMPDVVYHYKGKEYPRYFVEGSKEELIRDEKHKELEQATSSVSSLVTSTFSHKPDNHYYLFDSEFDAYDYVEKNGHPLIGRKFKHAHRIDELRDRLLKKYGEDINYSNPGIYAEALAGVEAMYAELKITSDLPRDLESYIGKKVTKQNTQRTPLMIVYEHSNYSGSVLDIENATNTVTWTHGAYNCYRTTANPDLTQEYQPNSNNWNDCISSFRAYFVTGANAVVYASFKDSYYAQYACSRLKFIIAQEEYITQAEVPNLSSVIWAPGCGHMNDQVSSIRIKVAWQGCARDWSDL